MVDNPEADPSACQRSTNGSMLAVVNEAGALRLYSWPPVSKTVRLAAAARWAHRIVRCFRSKYCVLMGWCVCVLQSEYRQVKAHAYGASNVRFVTGPCRFDLCAPKSVAADVRAAWWCGWGRRRVRGDGGQEGPSSHAVEGHPTHCQPRQAGARRQCYQEGVSTVGPQGRGGPPWVVEGRHSVDVGQGQAGGLCNDVGVQLQLAPETGAHQ